MQKGWKIYSLNQEVVLGYDSRERYFLIFGLIKKSRNKDTIPEIGIFSISATSKNSGLLYNSLNRDFLIFGYTEESRNRDLLKIRIWSARQFPQNWFYGVCFLQGPSAGLRVKLEWR